MIDYKRGLIELMLECEVLMFGEFTTKSGRLSPYFVNTGKYRSGAALARLGQYYATHIYETIGGEFDLIFGPAYKGIPLAVNAASAFYNQYNLDKAYCFNRKEAKDHGEGGIFIGETPTNGKRLIIIEDVITAGTQIRATLPLLFDTAPELEVKHMFISVDRREKGIAGVTAVEEVRREFGIEVHSIIDVYDIIEYMEENPTIAPQGTVERIKAYVAQYGG